MKILVAEDDLLSRMMLERAWSAPDTK